MRRLPLHAQKTFVRVHARVYALLPASSRGGKFPTIICVCASASVRVLFLYVLSGQIVRDGGTEQRQKEGRVEGTKNLGVVMGGVGQGVEGDLQAEYRKPITLPPGVLVVHVVGSGLCGFGMREKKKEG